jgi:flagellar motor switch protein FliN
MDQNTPEPAAKAAASAPPSMNDPLATLPTYARGLLQIMVPITVTLAAQRKPIQEILELGPGSIVKFDKTCDEPLELAVGERVIARGEVVKVGDKFGLRVGARQ